MKKLLNALILLSLSAVIKYHFFKNHSFDTSQSFLKIVKSELMSMFIIFNSAVLN